jgi:glycosyltransferase involved in cell wall biosynthesis
MKPKVFCVIPAFKEEKRISVVIKKIKKLKIVSKIIVVDDGSPDKTTEVAKKAGAEVVRYEKNQGVGYATIIGLKRAIGLRPDIIIFLDADGQHDPLYIPKFIEKITNGFDYAYGLRDLSNYPINRKIGNWSLTILTNLICPTKIRDVECGFRAFTYETAKKLNLKANRYEREVDFIYEVWRNKLKVSHVEIKVPKFYPKPAIIRGFKNFWYLLRRRFNF